LDSAHNNRLIITLTGPSGTGKDTLAHELTKLDPSIKFMVTATTRPPRAHEQDGVDYHFLSRENFLSKKERGEFLECNDAYLGNMYGTLKSVVEKEMANGFDLISSINWTGVKQFKEKMPVNTLSILILPPSVEELISRFENRQKTSKEDKETLARRLEQFRNDMAHIDKMDYVFTNGDMIGSCRGDYDHIVINDDVHQATQALHQIIKDERKKRNIS